MQFIFILFTILAGMTSALQSGANNTLQKSLHAQWWCVVIVGAATFFGSIVLILHG